MTGHLPISAVVARHERELAEAFRQIRRLETLTSFALWLAMCALAAALWP